MRYVSLILLILGSVSLFGQTSAAKWKSLETEGDTLLNRQDYSGALKFYNQAAELSKVKDRESKGVLYKRAICYYSLGDFQKALDDLTVFIPEYSGFPQAKLLRAFIYRELGKADEQLADIDELLSLNPMNPDLIKWKSGIYLDSDRFNEAKALLVNLQKFVNDEEIETQLGFAYYNLNSPDSAFIHFDNAMGINGGYIPAYIYISSLCLEQEAYDKALTYIDLALRLEPQNPTFFLYKGIALVETNEQAEGCRYLSKAFHAGLDQAGDYLKQYCYTNRDE